MIVSPSRPAFGVPCSQCGKPQAPNNMITVFGTKRGEPIESDWCLPCWSRRGSKPAAPVAEPPRPVDPLSHFGATSHKTYAEALERHHKVARYLGILPEIFPCDMSLPGPFVVCPDSELVPGFKAAKNPYAT